MQDTKYKIVVDKIRAAKIPDRGLDAEIECLLPSLPGTSKRLPKPEDMAEAGSYIFIKSDGSEVTYVSPCYTALIDEALRVLPPGTDYMLVNLNRPDGKGRDIGCVLDRRMEVLAANIPLAICAGGLAKREFIEFVNKRLEDASKKPGTEERS